MNKLNSSHLDVALAEEHLHCLLHDGQQPSVVHGNTTPHQVAQPQDLQTQTAAAAAAAAVRCIRYMLSSPA
jgi:hypothetical protein